MSELRKVYVIDDEDAVRAGVTFLLEASDLSVESFASAVEFLAEIIRRNPNQITSKSNS